MSGDQLESFDSRIARLEHFILGDNSCPVKKRRVTEMLASAHAMLDSVCGARENITQGMSRVDELDQLLAWEEEGDASSLAMARAEAILVFAETIGQRVRQLKQLDKSAPVLESPVLAQVSSHEGRFAALASLIIDDAAKEKVQSEDVRRLLGKYNNLTNELSRTFSHWDAVVTQVELDSNPPKLMDC